MSSDQQVRDAIRALAEAGPEPDVDAAWHQVRSRLDGRPAPVRSWARPGLLALAAAAALVVVVLLVGQPGDDGAVEVDSAGDPGGDAAPRPAPAEEAPDDDATGIPVTFPADAVAVAGPEGRALHVLDAGTGERAASLSGLAGGGTITSAAVTRDGDVWFVAQAADGPRLGRARWDAGDRHDLLAPDALRGASIGQVAVDPAGAWVAVGAMDPDGTCWLAVHAPATGRWRALRWPEDDPRGRYRCPQELSPSPDGSQLAFLNVHDSDGTEAFEAYVVDPDTPSLGSARLVAGDAWDVAFDPAGGVLALVGPTRSAATLRYLEGGPDVGVPPLGGIVDLQASLEAVVARLETGWVRLDRSRDEWTPTPIDRWTGA